MTRALVTFAVGEHRKLLDLSVPRFRRYADEHGYDLVVDPPPVLIRPASWYKVPALLAALDQYDEALWLDADIVICDTSRDLADEVPPAAWQALVRHHTPDGEVPNGGVWYVRPPMRPTLRAIWAQDQHLNHGWWEQAALLDLLGYHQHPARLGEPTELYEHTHWLGLEWNSHEQNDRHPRPAFAHATAGNLDWRTAVMRHHIARQPAQEGALNV